MSVPTGGTAEVERAEVRRQAIAVIGRELGPEVLKRCMALFEAEQAALARLERRLPDLAYGEHARQKIDLYLPDASAAPSAPVLLFVHGGGFVRGEKHAAEHPFNASVGRFAARHGFIGAVMGYRLAPEHRWPAGGDDVASAVHWLRANVARNGGDPDRIVLLGTSAGAVHVATYLERATRALPVRGLVLLSGLYGATAPERQDETYFGTAANEAAATLSAIAATPLPLYLACAEYDPARFQQEWLAALQRRFEVQQRLPRSRVVRGHNHYTLAMHLGSSDAEFGDEIIAFAREVTRVPVAGRTSAAQGV
jgi:acetyl esterase/lipase